MILLLRVWSEIGQRRIPLIRGASVIYIGPVLMVYIIGSPSWVWIPMRLRSCAILAHLTNISFVSNKRTRAKTWVLLVPSQGLVLSARTYNLSCHRSLSYTGETMIDYWLPLRMLSWLVPIWIPPLHVTRRVRARLADVLYQTQTIGDLV